MKTTLTLEDVERLEKEIQFYPYEEFYSEMQALLPLILPVIREYAGNPEGLRLPAPAIPSHVTDVLPCPFCGQLPFSGWNDAGVPGMEDCGYWGIDCKCGLAHSHADNAEDAREAWNNRPVAGGTSAHSGIHPDGMESKAQASQKTAQECSVCEVEPLGEVTFEVISGVEGHCLSVNDRRVAGPKPWGGGRVLKTWKVPVKHLLDAVGLPSSPPSSEDTEEFTDSDRLEHLMRFTSPPVDRAKLDRCIRSEREASTTTQKGGQGV